MYYETDTNDHGLRFNPLKACVVPRPIGWISTVDAAGAPNLAPFSFYNMVSANPPVVMFCPALSRKREHKHTYVNVEAMGEFTGSDPTEIHHLERDEEFLIELPKEVQILRLLKSHGVTISA